MYETQKRRQAEKAAEQHRNFIIGLFLAPAFLLGWFPIVWVISKIVGR